MTPKEEYYAVMIVSAIIELLASDIPENELNDPANFKSFCHAMANIAPCYIFNQLSGEKKDHLEFNHSANLLIFEFSKIRNNYKK